MQVASQGTSLHIDHVELGHAGLFACQATNEAGTAGAEVELAVHGEGPWAARGARGGWSQTARATCAFGRPGGPGKGMDGASGLDFPAP